MKRKFITILSTFLIIFSSTVSSFANPIAATTISYELLMALMGVGVSFGLSLPKDDSEYWDYTRSLKKHLQVVDDEYLDLLDKSVKEWKTNNNNKPDNEKTPFQVPLIPGIYDKLKQLFTNVGNDVSYQYKYVNHILQPIKIFNSSDSSDYISQNIDIYKVVNTVELSFVSVDVLGNRIPGSIRFERTSNSECDVKVLRKGLKTYEFTTSLSLDQGVGIFAYTNGNLSYWKGYGQGMYGYNSSNSLNLLKVPTGDIVLKPLIPYTPSEPNIDNDTIIIPGDLPNISIPSIESVPGHEEGVDIEPPFNVEPPIEVETPPGEDTETPPGEDTETPPGEDTGFPSFPSFGDSLDFSPMYLTNVTEKFPFSLPWDIGRLIEKFDVDPVAPVFDVPIVSENITLDLTEFSELAQIVRFFVLIGFILSLIFISTRLMG